MSDNRMQYDTMGREQLPSAKRRKLDQAPIREVAVTSSTSLNRPVSPPSSIRNMPVPAASSLRAFKPTWGFDDVPKQTITPPPPPSQPPPRPKENHQPTASPTVLEVDKQKTAKTAVQYAASPFQLTRIRDLAAPQNVDTVQLKDILGNPMVKECWNFNFLFDLDFVM